MYNFYPKAEESANSTFVRQKNALNNDVHQFMKAADVLQDVSFESFSHVYKSYRCILLMR